MRRIVPLLGALLACHSTPSRLPPVALHTVVRGGTPTLAVIPATGVQLNAHQPPALEFVSGAVVRIDQGAVTADSAYFAEPPWVIRPAGLRGRASLRVSYCHTAERVCQSERLAVRLDP